MKNLVSDIGVRALYLDDTCFKDVFYLPDVYKQSDLVDLASNIKEDRTSEELTIQVMLDWGQLSLPIERKTIAGKDRALGAVRRPGQVAEVDQGKAWAELFNGAGQRSCRRRRNQRCRSS